MKQLALTVHGLLFGRDYYQKDFCLKFGGGGAHFQKDYFLGGAGGAYYQNFGVY